MGVELATENAGFSEMEDVIFSDTELVCHVRNALRSATMGHYDGYNQLVGVLHHTEYLTPDEVALLVTSLKALSGAVSCIDSGHHESLLSAIFGMSMWNYGPDVMDALVELIVKLAASSGQYTDSCLDMLVSNFTPPRSFVEFLKKPRRKGQVLYHVHSALQGIANLLPLAPLRLEDAIVHKMPNVYSKEPLIVLYVENMLRLESSAMGAVVGGMMLKAVVDMAIELDVKIEWEDILQDDPKGIFEMELEDEETVDNTQQEGDELRIRESSRGKSFWGSEIAEKLDSLLVLMFEHLKKCNDAGRLIEVFEPLLQSFQTTVMMVYKLKFSQFVMFYACSLDPENCGMRFTNTLADIFMHRASPPNRRMSAVAYLASYLSRAKFLSLSFVAEILKRLVGWCLKYCETWDGDINPTAHKVFYSGCQAIMYVLCFRMRSLMDIPCLKSLLLHMPIEAIFNHPLNPLKVCLPSIVEEFLRQAKAARLFTTVSEQTFLFNNNMVESELSRAFGGSEKLDMFFPFDPCLLKNSDGFIRPNFVYWSMARTSYDDDEEGCSNEDVEDFGGSGENIAAWSSEEHDHHFDDDELDKMSITPKNSFLNSYMFGGDLCGSALRMPSRIRPSSSPESSWCTN
ncbi:RNA polymerase I-specific transcription initiation factor like [Actinidia chinensis var. chinensis]|uniref:RNA polymerase I-specific transcription initiation factor like n=1 Tax=Actinidia chinensis var. chinensis TaxID=1590841 RepID=A0A2R6R8G9_ACTCC|nr:RNA polymerase I-specific transcription initiation factor like [Actinidia chinensis var. chinensis]